VFTKVNKAETCSKGSRYREIYIRAKIEEKEVKRNLNPKV